MNTLFPCCLASVDRGQPLPKAFLQFMEGLLMADLSNVRVHEDRALVKMGALGVAIGDRIFLAPGAYRPDTQDGRSLLAHELTHLVQQARRGSRSLLKTSRHAPTGSFRPNLRCRTSTILESPAVLRLDSAQKLRGLANGGVFQQAPGTVRFRQRILVSDFELEFEAEQVAELVRAVYEDDAWSRLLRRARRQLQASKEAIRLLSFDSCCWAQPVFEYQERRFVSESWWDKNKKLVGSSWKVPDSREYVVLDRLMTEYYLMEEFFVPLAKLRTAGLGGDNLEDSLYRVHKEIVDFMDALSAEKVYFSFALRGRRKDFVKLLSQKIFGEVKGVQKEAEKVFFSLATLNIAKFGRSTDAEVKLKKAGLTLELLRRKRPVYFTVQEVTDFESFMAKLVEANLNPRYGNILENYLVQQVRHVSGNYRETYVSFFDTAYVHYLPRVVHIPPSQTEFEHQQKIGVLDETDSMNLRVDHSLKFSVEKGLARENIVHGFEIPASRYNFRPYKKYRVDSDALREGRYVVEHTTNESLAHRALSYGGINLGDIHTSPSLSLTKQAEDIMALQKNLMKYSKNLPFMLGDGYFEKGAKKIFRSLSSGDEGVQLYSTDQPTNISKGVPSQQADVVIGPADVKMQASVFDPRPAGSGQGIDPNLELLKYYNDELHTDHAGVFASGEIDRSSMQITNPGLE